MNKVVSIEIASQVFWIDEKAYAILEAYLSEIRQQLNQQDNAQEIFNDIELRVAELLFDKNSDQQKSLNTTHINAVIEQVGFIDDEDPPIQDESLGVPKESHLDVHNKILGGVCAGLAVRFNVPAVFFRLLFIALSALFGVGIILYAFFWVFLDSNVTRKSALAAQGRAQTAHQLASYDKPNKKSKNRLQKIIFSPISFLGLIVTFFISHFKKRKKAYVWIAHNFVSLGLFVLAIIVMLLIVDFNDNRYMYWPFSWLVSGAVMFLMVCFMAMYVRWVYLKKSLNKIHKKLKVLAALSIVVIISSTIYLHYVTAEKYQFTQIKEININTKKIAIDVNNNRASQVVSDQVYYRLKVDSGLNQQLRLELSYSGYGTDQQNAMKNTTLINYSEEFNGHTLTLNDHWSLPSGIYNRLQSIQVTVFLPPDITILSSQKLTIVDGVDGYYYVMSGISHDSSEMTYLSKKHFIHEVNHIDSKRLSNNERFVLNDKFCAVFFRQYQWDCASNIRQPVENNGKFDQAFIAHQQQVNALRLFLLAERSIFMNHLKEMHDLLNTLKNKYPVTSDLSQYVQHLVEVKSATEPIH